MRKKLCYSYSRLFPDGEDPWHVKPRLVCSHTSCAWIRPALFICTRVPSSVSCVCGSSAQLNPEQIGPGWFRRLCHTITLHHITTPPTTTTLTLNRSCFDVPDTGSRRLTATQGSGQGKMDLWIVGGIVDSELTLRSARILLSRIRTLSPVPQSDGGPQSLRSSCCG
ncbi:hypothetical protein PoB_003742200 [Plakobranchus ocellatus]|uniref:Uncharacterized protein n=1 Tax=Plakobranchus ocellatus TaxID=259542 RepID=A0AAV4AV80_9GAST|nr:hypothetical protein PoB_003742200 [Plakobranchus ocellatus]